MWFKKRKKIQENKHYNYTGEYHIVDIKTKAQLYDIYMNDLDIFFYNAGANHTMMNIIGSHSTNGWAWNIPGWLINKVFHLSGDMKWPDHINIIGFINCVNPGKDTLYDWIDTMAEKVGFYPFTEEDHEYWLEHGSKSD